MGVTNRLTFALNAAKDVLVEGITWILRSVVISIRTLKADQTSQTLKKTHRNYSKLVANQKETYKVQIIPLLELFQNDLDEITNYEDLVKDTFKTKEKTLKALTGKFEYMERGLKWIKQDMSILNLPIGKDILMKILVQGYKETKNE